MVYESPGRPRTNCPPPEELIELGKELVKWASEPTDQLRCRFCQWYSIEKEMLRSEWEQILHKPEFRMYYEKARSLLAQKYIDGSVVPSIAHRLINHYVPESKEEEKEMISYKINTAANAAKAVQLDLADINACVAEHDKKR